MSKYMLPEELAKILSMANVNVVRLAPGEHHFDPGKFNTVIIEKGASLHLAEDSVVETIYSLDRSLRIL